MDITLAKLVITAVFLLLGTIIALLPKTVLGDESSYPLWKRSRPWAYLIILIQISIYWILG